MEDKKDNEGLIKGLCYLGIFILLLFIVLPPLFRILFPEEQQQEKEEQKQLIMNLTCVKTDNYTDYKIITTINTNYIDEEISNSIFTYEVEYSDDIFNSDDIFIDEYETLKRVDNIDFSENGNKYVLTIDYINFDYSNEEALVNHRKMIAEQRNYYATEDFECQTQKLQ